MQNHEIPYKVGMAVRLKKDTGAYKGGEAFIIQHINADPLGRHSILCANDRRAGFFYVYDDNPEKDEIEIIEEV